MRLLCPHVDSTPGIRLILHLNKSRAPLAIFFLEMYLGAQSVAGIRMVSRMHYRQQYCRSNGNLKSTIEKGVIRCGGTSRARSIVARRKELIRPLSSGISEHAFTHDQNSVAKPGEMYRNSIENPVPLLFRFPFTTQLFAGQSPDAAGQVQGRAYVQDSMGQSFIAMAQVTLNGPASLETERIRTANSSSEKCSLELTPLR